MEASKEAEERNEKFLTRPLPENATHLQLLQLGGSFRGLDDRAARGQHVVGQSRAPAQWSAEAIASGTGRQGATLRATSRCRAYFWSFSHSSRKVSATTGTLNLSASLIFLLFLSTC